MRRDRWTYRGVVKTRCSNCYGVCMWHDEAWVCDRCGDEWYPDILGKDHQYDPPDDSSDDGRCAECGVGPIGHHAPNCPTCVF